MWDYQEDVFEVPAPATLAKPPTLSKPQISSSTLQDTESVFHDHSPPLSVNDLIQILKEGKFPP